MRSVPLTHSLLACALSVVGGFVDAVGYLHSGGFFLSFMSGNSTRLGIGIGGFSGAMAEIGASIVGLFIIGVITGTLLGHRIGEKRLLVVPWLETALLASAAALESLGLLVPALALAVIAMGMLNTIFQRDGEVTIGLTYMTGALVKVGQNLANALRGGPTFAWLPYLALWLSLVSGAACGTFTDHYIDAHAFWVAATAMGTIATVISLSWQRGFRI